MHMFLVSLILILYALDSVKSPEQTSFAPTEPVPLVITKCMIELANNDNFLELDSQRVYLKHQLPNMSLSELLVQINVSSSHTTLTY